MTQEPEFLFELRICRWAERAWPPDGDRHPTILVARQLGTRARRWDTLVFECDRDALGARAALGSERLDSDLLHVVRNAPRDWLWYRDALPAPDYPWRYVREAVHRAADRGLVETRSGSNGRIELRQRYEYPEWMERVIAIENKPDLDAAAARTLADQMERDVALGLADEVWVATRATGNRVEPALFERLPVEVGILTMGNRSAEVAWHATSLDVDAPGTRVLERPSGTDHDESAARFEYVDSEWKAAKRREIAERAYERGWRSFIDLMRPDCRHFTVRNPAEPLPYCRAKERHVTARECAGSCPEFSPEPPGWRRHDWPLDGGPGRATKRLLESQRERRR